MSIDDFLIFNFSRKDNIWLIYFLELIDFSKYAEINLEIEDIRIKDIHIPLLKRIAKENFLIVRSVWNDNLVSSDLKSITINVERVRSHKKDLLIL